MKGVTMKKLATRQIIILAVMGAVVLYGVYTLFGSSRQKGGVESVAERAGELKTFVSTVAMSATKDMPSPTDTYIADKAKGEWQKNIFVDAKSHRDWLKSKEPVKAEGGQVKKAAFTYTGFIDSSTRRVAIINGVEYAIGESLDVEGYVLKSVSPSKAVIQHKRDKTQIEVPFQE